MSDDKKTTDKSTTKAGAADKVEELQAKPISESDAKSVKGGLAGSGIKWDKK